MPELILSPQLEIYEFGYWCATVKSGLLSPEEEQLSGPDFCFGAGPVPFFFIHIFWWP
jgi:hypothetical protein